MPGFEEKIHKVLSSSIRKEIILVLSDSDMYLSELAGKIGVKPQTADFHLKKLVDIDIVEGGWEKGKKYYSLKNREILKYLKKGEPIPPEAHPKPPHEIVFEFKEEMSERLERIEEKLEEIETKVEKGDKDG